MVSVKKSRTMRRAMALILAAGLSTRAGAQGAAATPLSSSRPMLPMVPSVLSTVTPSFSIAPKVMFRRRGPRGAMIDYAKHTVWLSANVHDVLPMHAKPFWPSPVRLSVGRRGLGAGLPAEYVVGLDLDAARLPGSHPVWMQAKTVLHTLRLPGPAIVMGPNGTRALGLYW